MLAAAGSAFDDPGHDFVVLVNDRDEHSLWPHFLEPPAGWNPTFGPAPREDCLDHVRRNWTGLTPGARPAEAAGA